MQNIFGNNNIKSISVTEANRELDNNNVLIDVRESAEYKSGHAKGAKSYPLSTLNNITCAPLAKYDKVYVICQSGARSSRATAMLDKLGINAVNVTGGTIAWRNAGLEVEN